MDETTANLFRYGTREVTPAVTSSESVAAAKGKPFNYRIEASSNPTHFGAHNLPSWMTLNSGTGVLSGTPTAVGTSTFKVFAYEFLRSGNQGRHGQGHRLGRLEILHGPHPQIYRKHWPSIGRNQAGQGSITYSAGNNSYPAPEPSTTKATSTQGRWLASKPTSSNPTWIKYDFTQRKRSLNIRSKAQSYNFISEVPRIGPCKAPTTTPIGRPWTVAGETNWTRWQTKDLHAGFSRRVPLVQVVFTANNGDNTLGIGEIRAQGQKGLLVFRPTSRSTRPRPTDSKYSQVASISGRDIRFTDSTGGTLLPYQFDGWNPGADSYVWVKIPEVKPSSEGNTTIKMWWGNENAVTEFPSYVNNGEVWSSYAARWNMDDEEGPTILDSSPNRNHGQKTEVTSTPSGVLGGAQNFPTGRTDGIKIASPNFNLGSSFTGSMWIKYEGQASVTGNTNDIRWNRLFSAKEHWNQSRLRNFVP